MCCSSRLDAFDKHCFSAWVARRSSASRSAIRLQAASSTRPAWTSGIRNSCADDSTFLAYSERLVCYPVGGGSWASLPVGWRLNRLAVRAVTGSVRANCRSKFAVSGPCHTSAQSNAFTRTSQRANRTYLTEMSSVLVAGVMWLRGLISVDCGLLNWTASKVRVLCSTLRVRCTIICWSSSNKDGISGGRTRNESVDKSWSVESRRFNGSSSFSSGSGGCWSNCSWFSNSVFKAAIWSAWAFNNLSLTASTCCMELFSSSNSVRLIVIVCNSSSICCKVADCCWKRL